MFELKELPKEELTDSDRISPLIKFTLRGLDVCWMNHLGRWSHAYHLDGRGNPNESIPSSDVFYTLNVLLGYSRLIKRGYVPDRDLKNIFIHNAGLMPSMKVARYSYGMALWSSSELGYE